MNGSVKRDGRAFAEIQLVRDVLHADRRRRERRSTIAERVTYPIAVLQSAPMPM